MLHMALITAILLGPVDTAQTYFDKTVLARAHFVEVNLRVVTASPVQEQLRFGVVSRHNNLHEQSTQDALFALWRALWLFTQPPQIGAQSQYRLLLFLVDALRTRFAQRIEFFFEIGLNPERRIPPPFEFGGDEPVRGIDRIVLALRPGHLVARLVDGKRFLPDTVIVCAAMHLKSCHSSLDT